MKKNKNRKEMFCGIISRHLSESRGDFINSMWILSRKMNVSSIRDMQIIVDKEVKKHKGKTLTELYGIVLNTDMARRFPELTEIMQLKLSDLNKCILLMSILGFSTNEIADLLLSTPHSIQTMMLNIRKKYPSYADHLTR